MDGYVIVPSHDHQYQDFLASIQYNKKNRQMCLSSFFDHWCKFDSKDDSLSNQKLCITDKAS